MEEWMVEFYGILSTQTVAISLNQLSVH